MKFSVTALSMARVAGSSIFERSRDRDAFKVTANAIALVWWLFVKFICIKHNINKNGCECDFLLANCFSVLN